MKNYPLDYSQLFDFSQKAPYENLQGELYQTLNKLKMDLNFPAVLDDVGTLISFLVQLQKPKIIFEMGSGYGHSCFWYSKIDHSFIHKIVLTELRMDLKEYFDHLPWEESFKAKCLYHQGDAFEKLKEIEDIDFLLIDGVKANYLNFLLEAKNKLNANALVLIDNSYWRGSFLDTSIKKQSALKIKELHDSIASDADFQSIFLPFSDGVTLLRKLS